MPPGAVMAAVVFSVTLAFALAVGGLVIVLSGGKHRRRRLERAAGRRPRVQQVSMASLRRGDERGRFKALDGLLRRLFPGHADLRARLARTGRGFTMVGFLGFCAAVMAVGALVLWALMGLPIVYAGPAGLVAGWLVPNAAIGIMGGRRVKRFLLELPDAIDVMVRGLKSGLPITEMITTVADDFEGPVGEEFRNIANAITIGHNLEDALWDTASRIDVPEFNFLAVSVGLQRETGGNLTETLRNLSDLLRKRQQMRLKIRALSSEARASAYIIGCLPFVMLGVLYVMNPDYIGRMFEDTTGHYMLAGGVLSELIGAAVMFKMVRFEV